MIPDEFVQMIIQSLPNGAGVSCVRLKANSVFDPILANDNLQPIRRTLRAFHKKAGAKLGEMEQLRLWP